MSSLHLVCLRAVSLLLPALAFFPQASAVPGLPLIGGGTELNAKAESGQVSFKDLGGEGYEVKILPGEAGYPGLSFTQKDGMPFDFSPFGYIDASFVNTGKTRLDIALRADNAGDWQQEPWNTENLFIEPGERRSLTLFFGYSFGHKKGFPLNPKEVTRLLVFTGKTEVEKSFRIERISLFGPPGAMPPAAREEIRTTPKNGVLYAARSQDPELSRLGYQGMEGATMGGKAGEPLMVRLPTEKAEAHLRPVDGRWDLRQCLQVVVTLHNDGTKPVRPLLWLESSGGATDKVQAEAIAAGASREVAISFAPKVQWKGRPDFNGKGEATVAGSGTSFSSDAVAAVVISGEASDTLLSVSGIRADVPAFKAPDWLGKRPPIDGDWEQTFAEEFDAKAVDEKKWNVHAANYWDKASWFSRDNVMVGGGVAKMRYEKRTGHHNDDPKEKEFHYATGLLDTYGKWTQRYGYFEARVKLPTAPGLWPAFWLMPERGKNVGEQWQRQDTGNGGMEFDIIEHLTRWGPYRNNIAMHWDGYGEGHKQLGTDRIYMQPDKDGFITGGLLWLPGQAIYYINGSETARWENPRISSVPSCLLFTLPQGGWDNSPVDDAKLPDDFTIDYVRIWQRKDLASEKDGSQK